MLNPQARGRGSFVAMHCKGSIEHLEIKREARAHPLRLSQFRQRGKLFIKLPLCLHWNSIEPGPGVEVVFSANACSFKGPDRRPARGVGSMGIAS